MMNTTTPILNTTRSNNLLFNDYKTKNKIDNNACIIKIDDSYKLLLGVTNHSNVLEYHKFIYMTSDIEYYDLPNMNILLCIDTKNNFLVNDNIENLEEFVKKIKNFASLMLDYVKNSSSIINDLEHNPSIINKNNNNDLTPLYSNYSVVNNDMYSDVNNDILSNKYYDNNFGDYKYIYDLSFGI